MIREFVKGSDEQLSTNFGLEEFHCHCNYPECNITYVDMELVNALQAKRDEWGKFIHLNCGFRCSRHNKEVGGKPGSQHMIGKAADITVEGMLPRDVANSCEDFSGLGRYHNFTHVDVRAGFGPNMGKKSRWIG